MAGVGSNPCHLVFFLSVAAAALMAGVVFYVEQTKKMVPFHHM